LNENTPQDIPPQPAPEHEVPVPPTHSPVALSRKKTAKRRVAILVLVVVIVGGALWYFQKSFSLPLRNLVTLGNSVGTSVSDGITQNFSAPGPLVQVTKATPKKANTLTVEGVITQTNDQRATNGNLPPLAESATLDDIATLRIDDMFAQQYFAHVGPQGESAVTVASSVGYISIALGENLALGLYAGDAGVVTAWMNSPGHRANILDTHYTQIGVAVREGLFQGQETWIAVQVFGRPASDCPAPDANLKTSIDLSENQITAMAAQLQTDKAAIAAMSPQSGPQYNAQVQDYNNLAAQYNNLAAQTKTAIGLYDTQVDTFNACLAE
jgi:uncharacterized protein YkwD